MRFRFLLLFSVIAIYVSGQENISLIAFSNGGGLTTSQNNLVFMAFGQNFTGQTASTSFEVNLGVIAPVLTVPTHKANLQFNDIYIGDNYPNPFGGNTSIPVTISEETEVTLSVYTVTGEPLEIIFSGRLQPGNHVFNFDGNKISAGFYIYCIKNQNITITKSMLKKN